MQSWLSVHVLLSVLILVLELRAATKLNLSFHLCLYINNYRSELKEMPILLDICCWHSEFNTALNPWKLGKKTRFFWKMRLGRGKVKFLFFVFVLGKQ